MEIEEKKGGKVVRGGVYVIEVEEKRWAYLSWSSDVDSRIRVHRYGIKRKRYSPRELGELFSGAKSCRFEVLDRVDGDESGRDRLRDWVREYHGRGWRILGYEVIAGEVEVRKVVEFVEVDRDRASKWGKEVELLEYLMDNATEDGRKDIRKWLRGLEGRMREDMEGM